MYCLAYIIRRGVDQSRKLEHIKYSDHNLLYLFRDIHKHLLVQGEIKIPKRLASLKCGYKYVVVSNKEQDTADFEEIVEYQTIWRAYVNRCLVIERKCVTENSK